MKYYTIYLRKNDEVIVSGTAKECAVKMHKTLNGFHSLASKNKSGVHKKYVVLIEDINADEDIDKE